MRGKPDLNGAPGPKATMRPGSEYTNVGGPNRFKGQTKKLTESSGDTRSTGPRHRQPLAAARMAGEGIAGDLKASWGMKGGDLGGGPPRASGETGVKVGGKANELGNAHGASPIAGPPPLAR